MHKVLLVDDQKLIRDGITSLLALSGKVEVVGECADGSGVVNACIALQPHVVLLDLSMPVMNGVQTLAALQQADINIPVLILTTFDEHELVLKSIALGARGFLLKDAPVEQLVQAIHQVMAGKRVVDSELLLNSLGEQDPLTDKERQALRLAADGKSTSEIAAALYIAEGTARNYLSEAISKLNAANRIDAARIARQKGWL